MFILQHHGTGLLLPVSLWQATVAAQKTKWCQCQGHVLNVLSVSVCESVRSHMLTDECCSCKCEWVCVSVSVQVYVHVLELRCVSLSFNVHASVCVQFWELCTHARQMATQLLTAGGGNTQHGTEGATSTSRKNTDICTHQVYWHPLTNTRLTPAAKSRTKSDTPIWQLHPQCHQEFFILKTWSCRLPLLTSSGSSLRLHRCSFQDPSCGGEEAKGSGCCSGGDKSGEAPPSLCL